jgi:flagellar FliJ protein
MRKPFSLQPLLNLAVLKNESATRELGERNRQQDDAQTKLETLQQYRKEYQSRLQESTRNGMTQADLRNFQKFINKLDAAIEQQRKVLEQRKQSVQLGRGEFHTTQRKLKSFTTLEDRHIEAQKKGDAKSEQLALDEHSGRFAAYRMLNADDKKH